MPFQETNDSFPGFLHGSILPLASQNAMNDFADLSDFVRREPPGGDGRRSETDAARDGRWLVVERDGVFIAIYSGRGQECFRFLASQTFRPEVDEHQMVVCSTGQDVVSVGSQCF